MQNLAPITSHKSYFTVLFTMHGKWTPIIVHQSLLTWLRETIGIVRWNTSFKNFSCLLLSKKHKYVAASNIFIPCVRPLQFFMRRRKMRTHWLIFHKRLAVIFLLRRNGTGCTQAKYSLNNYPLRQRLQLQVSNITNKQAKRAGPELHDSLTSSQSNCFFG